jgi:hypothetical protein
MRNFKQPDTSDDLIITKWTKITPLEKHQIKFSYSEELAARTSGDPVNLSAIHKLASEQLTNMCEKSSNKHIRHQNGFNSVFRQHPKAGSDNQGSDLVCKGRPLGKVC